MDLIAELHASQLDHLELDHLLREPFPRVTTDGDDQVYARQDGEWGVRLVYGGTLLVRIDPGPALTAEILQSIRSRVQNDLLPRREPRIGRAILFARYPVRGCARVDNILQLMPAPPEAPQVPFLNADHPFVIEYLFRPSPNVWVHRSRRADSEKWLGLLLNLLLEAGIVLPEEFSDHRWTLTPCCQEGPDESLFLQGGYWCPNFRIEEAEFTSLDGQPSFEHVEPIAYRNRRGIEAGRSLELPADFAEMVTAFAELPFNRRQSFRRALYWFAHGRRAQPYSLSAHIVSLITAIEALLEPQENGWRCPQCGKGLTSGTQRFVDFVEVYSPEVQTSQRLRREFYRLRSKVAHGGVLLRRDQQIGPTTGITYHEEEEQVLEVLMTTRTVLTNWLLKPTQA